MDKRERTDKIEDYGRGYEDLSAALAAVPREAWKFRPAPGEWSIVEVLGHLVESELMGVTRLNKLIAEPGSTLMPYDESKWAQALHYQDQNAEDALQIFKLMRHRTYQTLKSLPERMFANAVVHPENPHPEFGEVYDIDKWLNIYAWHVGDHLEQIENNHKAWRDQGKAAT